MGFDTTIHKDLEIDDDDINIDSIDDLDELIDYFDSINYEIYNNISNTNFEYNNIISQISTLA